jgi:hypothetical protein
VTTAGCIDPQTVTPDSLLMYLDGEAPAEVSQHVAACPACAAEAASLNRLQEQLGAALFRFDCPPSQVLGEYAIDLVTPEDRTSVAQHVVDCPRCTSELRSMREFLVADDLLLPARSGVAAGLRRIVASLFPPAPALAPAVALRGSASATAQTYRAGDLTLTLGPGLQTRSGRGSLMGLLVHDSGDPEEFAGSVARLLAPTGASIEAEIDELGNFAFDDLQPDTYRLELHVGDVVIEVEDVAVTA